MYSGNDFYGIREIFLEYAGLPKWFPFPVAVQHGWQLVSTRFEQDSNPPEVWVWSSRIGADYLNNNNAKSVRCVGSPFVYLLRNINYSKEELLCGTICMPPHSSHFAKTNYSVDAYVNEIIKLGPEYEPFTVMLYYLDMTDDVVNLYKSYGFDVVCNGSIFDVDFLKNFIKNSSGKKYCISGMMGSGNFFCSIIGMKFINVNLSVNIVNEGNKNLTEAFFDKCNAAMAENLVVNRIDQDSFVRDELGVDFVMSRREMRWLIIKNYFKFRFIGKFGKHLIRSVLVAIGINKPKKILK